ncbi:uncharacterized protein [Amphiura filiformis]|uniref:uncharacterized protein n=1 Tax=Amphiura filiformis TaxID=82378 RepID=UPI003B20F7F9
MLGLPSLTAVDLRQSVVTFMRRNSTVQGPDGTIDFTQLYPDWNGYCDEMAQNGNWADHVVLVATAHHLRRDIMVVMSSPQSQDDQTVCRIGSGSHFGGNPIMLGHLWELHYQSLQTAKNTCHDNIEDILDSVDFLKRLCLFMDPKPQLRKVLAGEFGIPREVFDHIEFHKNPETHAVTSQLLQYIVDSRGSGNDMLQVCNLLRVLKDHGTPSLLQELFRWHTERKGGRGYCAVCTGLFFDTPAEILSRGPEARQAYLKASRAGTKRVYRTRLMLVGQERVGKTSLKKSITGQRFNDSEPITDGVDARTFVEVSENEVSPWRVQEAAIIDLVEKQHEDALCDFMTQELREEQKRDQKLAHGEDHSTQQQNRDQTKTSGADASKHVGDRDDRAGNEEPKVGTSSNTEEFITDEDQRGGTLFIMLSTNIFFL